MKKKEYLTPGTKVVRMESVSMLAASATLGTSHMPANDSEVLSNKDVWADGLWK